MEQSAGTQLPAYREQKSPQINVGQSAVSQNFSEKLISANEDLCQDLAAGLW